ncbi:hypothetical protein CDAR_397601 [Caerostris darwini]|uniref:Uncharacterized protein n=1 Tax=Caerostris darwini TaxID=1538125 RepID=A0AAV4T914_9ARAC|nr:hypothetical protein CDAR_397601 [Caerostris darwini]
MPSPSSNPPTHEVPLLIEGVWGIRSGSVQDRWSLKVLLRDWVSQDNRGAEKRLDVALNSKIRWTFVCSGEGGEGDPNHLMTSSQRAENDIPTCSRITSE